MTVTIWFVDPEAPTRLLLDVAQIRDGRDDVLHFVDMKGKIVSLDRESIARAEILP